LRSLGLDVRDEECYCNRLFGQISLTPEKVDRRMDEDTIAGAAAIVHRSDSKDKEELHANWR